MLRIAKLAPGGERYYFSTVAETTDTPDGLLERDPYWLGAGAAGLGLSGTASAGEMRSLFRGVDPVSGEVLSEGHARRVRVAAFDVTFSVPKSVSVLHALAGSVATAAVERVQAEAVAAVLAHAEREVLSTRRSAGGTHFEIPVDGAIAVLFRHRTSRANDPHLHTHLVLANLAEGGDGRWRALDARALFGRQRELRALYEAHVRAGLSEIGISFGPMRGDFADVSGISPQVIGEFSRQRRRIVAALAAEGIVEARDAALLAAELRPAKDRSRSYEELSREWVERGYRVGLSRGRLAEAAGRTASTAAEERGEGPEWVARAAARGDGTFSFSDLVVARATSLPAGARVPVVTDEVRAAVEAGVVIRLGSRFTTPAHEEALERSSREIAALASAAGARVATYRSEGGRAPALAALCDGLPAGPTVALAPGPRASRRFEASSGIETFPISMRREVTASLQPGCRVVVAEAGAVVADELREVFRACVERDLVPVLFGEERSLQRARVLEPARREMAPLTTSQPARHGTEDIVLGPRERAVVVASPLDALAQARREARELVRGGAAVVLALPDTVLTRELGPLPGVRVATAPRALEALEREEGPARAVLVVLGGAGPLEASPWKLRSVSRLHVLVRPPHGDVLGFAAEAVRPAHLLEPLGPVGKSPAGRSRWRADATVLLRGIEQSLPNDRGSLERRLRRERAGGGLGL